MKLCKKCGLEKPADKKNFGESDGYLCSPCNECRMKSKKEREAANPEKYKTLRRNRHRKTLYNLSECEFKEMEKRANYCCEICSIPFSELKRNPDVDHCHATGIVRGLLCSKCNTALGSLEDNITFFYKAIKYLQDRSKKLVGEIDYSKYQHLLDKRYKVI